MDKFFARSVWSINEREAFSNEFPTVFYVGTYIWLPAPRFLQVIGDLIQNMLGTSVYISDLRDAADINFQLERWEELIWREKAERHAAPAPATGFWTHFGVRYTWSVSRPVIQGVVHLPANKKTEMKCYGNSGWYSVEVRIALYSVIVKHIEFPCCLYACAPPAVRRNRVRASQIRKTGTLVGLLVPHCFTTGSVPGGQTRVPHCQSATPFLPSAKLFGPLYGNVA